MSGEIQKTDVSWLAEYQGEDDKSLDKMSQHRVLSRAQILQALSRNKEALKEHGQGAVISVPGSHLICDAKSSFLFVPLFFFEEFIAWLDTNDPSGDSPIAERSFDERSELALKCRNKELRLEPYGDGLKKKNKEHLNFSGIIYGPEGHPLQDQPITLSFSGGEHWNGESFCSAISSRRVGGRRVPSYLQVWEMRTEEHTNKKGQSWHGYQFTAPAEHSLLVDGTHAPGFKVLHEELARQYEDRTLEVDFSDADDSMESAPTSANLED